MAEAHKPAGAPAARFPRAMFITAGLASLAFVLVLIAARTAGPVDAASLALAAAGAALVYTLRRLYAVVRALARPDALATAGRGVGHFTQAELREEKFRLLRAIKELEFDHGMGKLSTADFEAVIGTYRLRAIEVMRALDGGGALHPELQKLLAEREAKPVNDPAAAPEAPAAASLAPEPERSLERSSPDLDRTSRICAHCTGPNDNDAKFCKHCGVSLERRRSPVTERRGNASSSGEIP